MLLTDGLPKLLRWNESKVPLSSIPPPWVTGEGNLTVHPWRNLSETNKPRSDGLGQRGEKDSYANTASQSLIILILSSKPPTPYLIPSYSITLINNQVSINKIPFAMSIVQPHFILAGFEPRPCTSFQNLFLKDICKI